jgi:hypothetical protein
LPSILVDESSVSKHLLFLFIGFVMFFGWNSRNPFVFLRFFFCVFFVNFSGWPCDFLLIT